MNILQMTFYTLIALGVLVTFHELGHFWVARRCGVKVLRFSIGFGFPLLKWYDKKGTEFVIAALPLGGYVKMVDEREGDVAAKDLPHAFTQKTVGQRIAVVIAGPLANFLLAFIAFWLVFLAGERGLAPVVGTVGKDSLAESAGFEPGMEIVAVGGKETTTWTSVNKALFNYIGVTGDIPFTVIYPESNIRYELLAPVESWLRTDEEPSPLRELGVTLPFELEGVGLVQVMPDSAAERAGLRKDDLIKTINGWEITDINAFIDVVSNHVGNPVELGVERDNASLILSVTPQPVERNGKTVGQIGVQLSSVGSYPESLVRSVEYGVFGAFVRGAEETWEMTSFVVKSIGKLLVGDLSPKNLSGPITIAKVAGDSAKSGIDSFVRFIAILSIMLGVMNLLPIPVLDGGHLMYYLIEAIKGSPVSDRIQLVGFKIGFAVVMGLMVFALYNDFSRL